MAGGDATPRTTKLALVGTLAAAAAVAVAVLSGAAATAHATGALLGLLTALFLLRVAGQLLVALRAPSWLPPMHQWNFVPYRVLLPVQLVFLAAMTVLAGSLLVDGPLASRSAGPGRFLIGFSALYAAAMVLRYAVRMRIRPAERWFGGTIPIVFHLVLATFGLTLGAHHVGA